MLQKASRLPSAEFRTGKYRVIGTPYFSLRVRSNQNGKNRIGVVIPNTVHKSAVRRNFWKRQAKAELSAIVGGGKDLLIVFSPKVNALTKEQFKKTLTTAISQI